MMTVDNRLEGDFYQCMHRLDQVDQAWNQEVLRFYAQYFTSCQHVLDIGCGEGQFIEALVAKGVCGSGIDIDARMIESCRDKGFDVVQSDLFDYLPQHQGAFDGIFSSNLIEHLPAEEGFRFVELAYDSLLPGGIFVVATPNPASLIVHLHEFWRDPTHVRLYTSSLLEFALSGSGFEQVHSGENPKTIWTPPRGFGQVPQLLKGLSISANLSQVRETDGSLRNRTSVVNEKRKLPFWRRLAFGLRRRLARFLTDTVLFEEFASLQEALFTSQQIDQTLYRNLGKLLIIPREIYARGVKPVVQPEE